MIDTILFDLDNTLLDFNKAERIAVAETLRRLGMDPQEAALKRYSQLNLAQWKLLEQGKISRDEVKIRRFQLLFDEMGITCPAEKAAQIYESLLGIGHYFMEGAQELLITLSPQYRMYLVTNGTANVQKGRIHSAGLKQYFQGIFISEEIGFDKPNVEFFTRCFARIPSFSREDTILIGDSLTSDIQGGKNADIRTVWFNPAHEQNSTALRPDYEVDRLKDIVPLLESLKVSP